jgi:hypothetical protein
VGQVWAAQAYAHYIPNTGVNVLPAKKAQGTSPLANAKRLHPFEECNI